MRKLGFGLSYLVLAVVLFGFSLKGVGFYSGAIILFVMHPFLDAAAGMSSHARDDRNVDSSVSAVAIRILNGFCWGFAVAETAMLFYCLSWVNRPSGEFQTYELLGLTISLGLMTGAFGITVAHELVHRRSPIERALGVWLLLMVNYAHYRVEHVFGHHRHVGLYHDPATARRDESLYRFWLRAFPSMIASAFRIERDRAKTIWQNRMFHYAILTFAMNCSVYFGFGWIAWGVFVGQGIVAVLLLGAIDYIEHYGLARADHSEPVKDYHSWDSTYALTNFLIFNLGKHSHHHRHASLPYYNLNNLKTAGQHPYGYSTMVLLAFVPPLWFRVMHPRINQMKVDRSQSS